MAVLAEDVATRRRVGRYEILSHLATGGMARLYLAKAGGLGAFERYVVLKTILPDRASDQRFVTMFLDEARVAATLNHQNIAQVYEVDEADGNLFITMEYVHGENLRTILEATLRKGWTIPVELAVTIVSSAAAGLHHAHERKGKNGQPLNIVHRDVSPANIMVGFDGGTKLLDFGIAKADERATKTQQGTIKGKYGYMSPEQCRGKAIDRRSDVFALGIVLYEITTLRRAYRGHDDFDTMRRIVNGDLVPPSVAVPGYPRELEAIVLTAMARDPDYRFQTAQEFVEALDAFLVRAKLQGSPSAVARFMTQLFGVRREPWLGLDPDTSPDTIDSLPGDTLPSNLIPEDRVGAVPASGGDSNERTEISTGPAPAGATVASASARRRLSSEAAELVAHHRTETMSLADPVDAASSLDWKAPAAGSPLLPASGLPASGLPASGLPASGLPASGPSASGLPASGPSASGASLGPSRVPSAVASVVRPPTPPMGVPAGSVPGHQTRSEPAANDDRNGATLHGHVPAGQVSAPVATAVRSRSLRPAMPFAPPESVTARGSERDVIPREPTLDTDDPEVLGAPPSRALAPSPHSTDSALASPALAGARQLGDVAERPGSTPSMAALPAAAAAAATMDGDTAHPQSVWASVAGAAQTRVIMLTLALVVAVVTSTVLVGVLTR